MRLWSSLRSHPPYHHSSCGNQIPTNACPVIGRRYPQCWTCRSRHFRTRSRNKRGPDACGSNGNECGSNGDDCGSNGNDCESLVEIYRPIFGFYRYIGIGLNRSWQNPVIFLTHPDNLRKKAQRSKSRQLSYNNASRCGLINKQTRLTMEHASAVTTETKASSGSFAMLEATTCRCCVRINSHCTSGSFRSTKSLTDT